MKIIKISAIAALALATSVASASEIYFGGSFAELKLKYSETGISKDASLNAIAAKLGSKFNENFSAEVRFGLGVGDETFPGSDYHIDFNLALKNFYGAYLKGGVPVTDSFYPYAVLGYTKGKYEVTAAHYFRMHSFSESESDTSFGIGADFKMDGFDLNIEYMNYLDKDAAEISGFSIGFSKAF